MKKNHKIVIFKLFPAMPELEYIENLHMDYINLVLFTILQDKI